VKSTKANDVPDTTIRVSLYPTEDGRGIHVHAALLHHLRQIPLGDAILAIPPNTDQDDLHRKAAALEHTSS
jgi:hypothetical protein